MNMVGPQAALLGEGERLHLNHGPIDLIIGVDAETPELRQMAFEAACERFQNILGGLVQELSQHRQQLTPQSQRPLDPVARRMYRAAAPFCAKSFLTPMIAVAGAVADEVLAAICSAVPLRRAYVNNGGDIAVYLAKGAEYSVAMAQHSGGDLGRVRFASTDGIGGIATSGAKGRSHSFGIADSVTVLAANASQADVAATLIANAVDLPGNPGIQRRPANELQPDSDLGARMVVTAVPLLDQLDRDAALESGHAIARSMLTDGHIKGAALYLQNQVKLVGQVFGFPEQILEMKNA